MLLSIVIPIFNGDSYLKNCLDSILTQIPEKCEIVILNDGSSDGSEKLIYENYQKQIDAGIVRYFYQENRGVSVARNSAINKANGEYIGFIDCDDIISDDYFESIYKHLINKTADILEFGYKLFAEGDRISENRELFVHKHFGELKSDHLTDLFINSIWYPVTRIYKKSLFHKNDLKFPEGVRFCEDMMLLPFLYENAQSVYQIDKALYFYRLNMDGATFNVKPDYKEKLIEFYRSIKHSESELFIYLKMNIFYILFNLLKLERGKIRDIPKDVRSDIKSNRLFFFKNARIISKSKLVLILFPKLMLLQCKLRNNMGMGLLKVKR